MDALYMLNRLVWLMALANCLVIVLLTGFFPYQNQKIIQRGQSFVGPLIVSLASAVHLLPSLATETVLWLGEILVLLFILASLLPDFKPMRQKALLYLLWTGLTVLVLAGVHMYGTGIVERIPRPHYFWPLAVLAGLVFLMKKRRGEQMQLLWVGSLSIAGAHMVHFFGHSLYMPEVSAILRLAGYFSWSVHFLMAARAEYLACRREIDELKHKMDRTAFYAAQKREKELDRSRQQVLENAKKDGLTGALNRISIMDVIQAQLQRHPDQSCALLMFDIDRFKQINDRKGHVEGDKALVMLAQTARSVIREEDRLGRYGGDEFMILLPTLNMAEARLVADRLRQRVEALQEPSFSISIGIAIYPQDGTSVPELIEMADKGLYRSKQKGGNAVSHAPTF